MGEFVPLHFVETMIDHLEIDSIIHHVESDEAKEQIKKYGMPPAEEGGSGPQLWRLFGMNKFTEKIVDMLQSITLIEEEKNKFEL